MVVGIVSNVAGQILRRGLTQIVPKYVKEFGKFDVRFHSQIFGKTGGRGFRHGRDAGLAIGSTASQQGSGLDPIPFQPGTQATSRKKPQAYSRYGNVGSRRRGSKRCYCRGKRR